MKKNLISMVGAGAVSLCLALSLAACGSANSAEESTTKQSSSQTTKTATPQASSSDKKSSTASSGKYASIDEYVQSSEVQSQLASVKSQAESGGMTLDVRGEDNALVYDFTLPAGMSASTAGLADKLNSGLDGQASTFQSIATMMKSAVEVDNPVVRVIYRDSAGTTITSRDFASQ
ncbi:DUF4854 domain-containing protein [Bifidobacterium crudilactis]|uniref:DUF4854 domain-containing protein n=1 Tax=Bifidobacterium crudilactis TaxID=327277 RepID=UPI0023550C79|nr:DUF4854 domain-containing protein [Bifidobacterium crudilactis]